MALFMRGFLVDKGGVDENAVDSSVGLWVEAGAGPVSRKGTTVG